MFARCSGRLAPITLVVALAGAGMLCADSEASAAGEGHYYSTYFAGYLDESSQNPPGDVTAQFEVPTITSCGHKTQVVGIGVQAEDDIENTLDSILLFGCQHGQTYYAAYLEADGSATAVTLPVTGGDTIVTSANMNVQGSSVSFSIVGGDSQSITAGDDTAVSAFIGSIADVTAGNPDKPAEVPDFGSIPVTNADIDGSALGSLSTGLSRAIRSTNGKPPPSGIVQILPRRVSGASFTLKFKHN
jgi:hypothetical protein